MEEERWPFLPREQRRRRAEGTCRGRFSPLSCPTQAAAPTPSAASLGRARRGCRRLAPAPGPRRGSARPARAWANLGRSHPREFKRTRGVGPGPAARRTGKICPSVILVLGSHDQPTGHAFSWRTRDYASSAGH